MKALAIPQTSHDKTRSQGKLQELNDLESGAERLKRSKKEKGNRKLR
jgi:hypothetical protein